MKLEVGTIDTKLKVLIVAKQSFPFIKILKSELLKHGVDVFFSSYQPKIIDNYDYCFFINEQIHALEKIKCQKNIFIFVNQDKKSDQLYKQRNKKIKIISLIGEIITVDQVDKILWFSFSKTKEPILKIYGKHKNKNLKFKILRPSYDIKKILTPQRIVGLTISLTIFIHVFFFIPLAITSYLSYLTFINLNKEQYKQTTNYLNFQKQFLKLTKKSYSLVQPTYLFLSLGALPGGLIDINEKTGMIFNKILINQKGFKDLVALILNQNKNQAEKELLTLRLNILENDLQDLEENLIAINNQLPEKLPQSQSLKKKIIAGIETIAQLKKIFPYLEDILAKNSEKKYLILFANNMELRPLGVMIENHKEARPQSGLSTADIVYEAVAEGGITRFLAIYYCQDAAYIGPIRSARIYFIKLLQEYGNYPLYAHVGGANTPGPADALGEIRELGWGLYNDLNQFAVPFPVFLSIWELLPLKRL